LQNLSDADAQLAAQFGYNPVFKREFGYLSTFSFAVSISGLFATIMTTFSYPLYAGGSASAVWCWLISGAGCMCIAVSVTRGSGIEYKGLTIDSALLPNSSLPILPQEDCEIPNAPPFNPMQQKTNFNRQVFHCLTTCS
jgi:hypothetical protein